MFIIFVADTLVIYLTNKLYKTNAKAAYIGRFFLFINDDGRYVYVRQYHNLRLCIRYARSQIEQLNG